VVRRSRRAGALPGLLIGALVALGAFASGVPAQLVPLPDPLQPDEVLELPAGPRIVRFDAPGSAVAALRVSLPLAESQAESGGGRVLLGIALGRVAPMARALGVRVEGSRTFHGLSYSVTGPSAFQEQLAWILREALRAPSEEEARAGLARLATELERELETPSGVLEARLRAGVAPALSPQGGTAASLATLSPSQLHALWARTHRREEMTVVIASPLPMEVVLAGIMDAGIPEGAVEGPFSPAPASSSTARSRTEVLRSWYGEAYPLDEADDPRAAVAARLMAEELRSLPGRTEAGVQLWELGGRSAIVVTGAAYPAEAATLRRRIQGVRGETAGRVSPEAVRRVVAELRRETLLAARTPAGLIGVVGYHLEATGDPAGARLFLDRLAGVNAASVSSLLSDLLARSPVTADVRP